jgi:hypothetical protein
VGNIKSSFALKQVKYQTALPLQGAEGGKREMGGRGRTRTARTRARR